MSKEEVRQAVGPARREGGMIALVPTMGALHEGHLSLVRAARSRADVVAVSIFVNPTQFGAGEDLAAYPRDLDRDLGLLSGEGVDFVFTPSPETMYAPDAATVVDPGVIGTMLEGAVRPGHFQGVATVVTKLLAIIAPDLACFGEKDYQQLLVVRRLVRDLDLPVTIVACETVREIDGLALSSRNTYLSPAERAAAPSLYRSLSEAVRRAERGETDVAALERTMRDAAAHEPALTLDYAVIADEATLEPLTALPLGMRARALISGRIATTHLIDNVAIVGGDLKPAWQKYGSALGE